MNEEKVISFLNEGYNSTPCFKVSHFPFLEANLAFLKIQEEIILKSQWALHTILNLLDRIY